MDAGWNVSLLGPITTHPLQVLITNGEERERIVLYIWNITHGGKTRKDDEYRIQFTGVSSPLLIGADARTLVLGWHESGVFAAFDAFHHQRFGRSPSLQVARTALEDARQHGLSLQQKEKAGKKEIVATFTPGFIIEYLQDVYPAYHAGVVSTIDATEAAIMHQPLDVMISPAILASLPLPRRRVIRTINQKVRERKFQHYVKLIYAGACAICGLQANLIEAAHIKAVGEDGTDEITNGVLLCRNHHKAYDAGLLGIGPDYSIRLSRTAEAKLRQGKRDGRLDEFIASSRVGQRIFLPAAREHYPNPAYLAANCKAKGR